MRVPLSWLREYVEITLPTAELAERLTLAGLAVDAIEALASGQALEVTPLQNYGNRSF